VGARLRVLHGPVNVGNQPWVLSRNERLQGIHSDLVVNYGTWLGYPADRVISDCGRRSPGSMLKRAVFGISAPFRYHVLHYYFGRSFFCWDDYGKPNRAWFLDLRLARSLGKKVFFTLQGCDVRLSGRSAEINQFTPCKEGHCQAVPACRSQFDLQRGVLIDQILPLADRVFVLNPELVRFVPGAVFLPYASVDLNRFSVSLPRTDGPIRIVHAPSDPLLKGSAYIIAAVERLQKRYPIDFQLIQGLPHEEALKRYQEADLVIDQLLFGWYGGLAVEVMAMGKPVAAYIRESDLSAVPPQLAADLPILVVRLDTIEGDLEQLIIRRSEWPDWGRASRRFVEKWHDPARIARSMIKAYTSTSSSFTLEG
jgi:glycosyltransferase involved in cell wall biosynthesis